MTLSEARTAVGELIDQSVVDDSRKITKTMVDRFLNIGYKRAVNAVVSAYEDFYLRESTADLVVDQKSYSLPSDARKLVRLDVGYSASTTRYQGVRLDRAHVDPNAVFSESAPAYYLIGDAIELNPTPSSAVTDGLRLYYVEKQAPLNNNTDEIKLPIGYEDLPITYAVAKAKQTLELDGEAQAYLQEFGIEMSKMKSELINRTKDNNDSVVITDPYLDNYDI